MLQLKLVFDNNIVVIDLMIDIVDLDIVDLIAKNKFYYYNMDMLHMINTMMMVDMMALVVVLHKQVSVSLPEHIFFQQHLPETFSTKKMKISIRNSKQVELLFDLPDRIHDAK